jgi:hypothetical protein
MTETMTVTTVVGTVETPKQGALKRFARAFYAKASKAAQSAKGYVVRHLGDNEQEIGTESTTRTTLRYVTAVPKWVGHALVFAFRTVLWIANVLVAGVVLASMILVGVPALLIAAASLVIFKVVQGLALVLRTPYLMVRGDDCLKTDWSGYGNLWKPQYFLCTRIQQVFAAQLHEQMVELAIVPDAQAPKGHATAKQHKTYPSRIPAMATA